MIDVLAFGPHPDDVELFAGGVMARMRQLGHRTAIVDLTRGEMASNGTPEERAREAEEAAEILGLTERVQLGLPDTRLDPRAPEQLEAVVAVLRRLEPELVLVPWRRDRHPDHEAASALVDRALFLAGLRKTGESVRPRAVFYYPMRHRARPSLVVDTTLAAAEKRAAIGCYRSQLRRDGSTLIASMDALEAIEARDRYVGSMIGVAYGEALVAARAIGVVDPLALVRANAFPGAHAFDDPEAP